MIYFKYICDKSQLWQIDIYFGVLMLHNNDMYNVSY